HNLTARDTDAAGNTGTSTAVTYTLDTTPPTVAITSAGGLTNQAAQTIAGTVDRAGAGSTVAVLDGTTILGSATVDQNGAWSASVTLTGDGVHTLTAWDTDAAGNTATSNAVSYTLDTMAPTVAITSAGGLTNQPGQTIIGKGEGGTMVTVLDGTTPLGTATVAQDGTWSIAVTLSGEGVHSLTASDTDAAGNAGISNVVSYMLDETAPAAPVIDGFTPDTGVAGDKITAGDASHQVTLVGTAEKGSTVTLYDGASLVPLATISASDGTWTYTTTGLSAGTHSFTAKATDSAGNVSAASAALDLILDPVAPTVTALADDIAPGTTLNAGKNVTFTVSTSKSVMVAGTPSLTLNDGGTATYSSGSGTNALTFTYTVAGSDASVADLLVTGLTGGTITDAAGNALDSTGVNLDTKLVVDTQPPAVTAHLSNDTGTSSTDGITADDSLSGTASANATVKILNGSTQIAVATADASGKWSVPKSVLNLKDGTYTLTASETDLAGNTGTAQVTFSLDTQAPKPTVGQIVASNGTITFTGTSEANSSVKLYNAADSSLLASTTATANGGWSVTAPINLASINSYLVGATDLAGNTGNSASKFIVGSSGADILTGTKGQSDVFAFLPGSGNDTITNFETTAAVGTQSHDVIELSGSKFTTFTQLMSHITQGPTGAVISLDSANSITLTGVSAASLWISDFRFA
ncbi:MAG: hypothetical protein JO110_04440, partial [Acetobacteraceae bacterium]|nr:hypothetical protein [Acetobacteraceae bacterium]